MKRPESFKSQIGRFDALLSRYLDRPGLLDALHALSVLDGVEGAPTLTELVLARFRADGPPGRPMPSLALGELFERREAQYRPEQARSRDALRGTSRFLCRALGAGTPVAALSPERIERALARCRAAATANSHIRRLRLAVNWAVRAHLLDASPLRGLAERRVDWKEPAFFPPDRVERIFRTAEAHPGALAGGVGACLALGFFCGVRTAEIHRARWEDLDLDAGTLRIPRPKGATCGAKPRLVELEANAAAWLRLWRDWAAQGGPAPRGPVVPEPFRLKLWKRERLAPAGLSWGNDAAHNVMRHTYATMHVAAFRNAGSTALNLGHGINSAMLERHYRGLVPRAVARSYWEIYPSGRPLPPPAPSPGRGFRTDLARLRGRPGRPEGFDPEAGLL